MGVGFGLALGLGLGLGWGWVGHLARETLVVVVDPLHDGLYRELPP